MEKQLQKSNRKVWAPNSEVQRAFCASTADWAIIGGGAGSGKTVVELLEGLRYAKDPTHTGIVFRRLTTSIRTPGGLWDTADRIFRDIFPRVSMIESQLLAKFPMGGKFKFCHLEHEKNKYGHHGGQYSYICFDELQEFTKSQVMYIISRNRRAVGSTLKAYCRSSCNATAESWVRDLLAWWIDPETGLAIPERAGQIRYYTVVNDDFVFVDEDWRSQDGDKPQSIAFFPATIDDNPDADPTYRSKLQAMDDVTRERLLHANWNVVQSGGMFQKEWFKIINAEDAPRGIRKVRYWDMAATEKKQGNNPDFTAGGEAGMYNGDLYIYDVLQWQMAPANTEEQIKITAEEDGRDVAIGIEQEKGSAGRFVTDQYQRTILKGFEVIPDPVTGQKENRAGPWSALAKNGHVYLIKGAWNSAFIAQCMTFPFGKKDMVDCVSGCYRLLTSDDRVWPKYGASMFVPVKVEWEKKESGEVVVLVHLVFDKMYGIWGNCFVWSRKKGKLFVYGEIIHRHPVAEMVIQDVRSKAQVPWEGGNVSVKEVLVNEDFATTGKNTYRILKKVAGKVRVNHRMNEPGGVLLVNQLMVSGLLSVDTACIETDQQYRGWTKKNGRPAPGFPLCQALCGVVTSLRDAGELAMAQEESPAPQHITERVYSPKAMRARENIRRDISRNTYQAPRRQQFDFLAR